MTPHTIYFARHGETEWNVQQRLQGGADSPLTENGRAHAVQIGMLLRELVDDFSALRFASSPQGRAVDTMHVVRSQLGLPDGDFVRDARLAEIRFGAWEGLTWPHIRAQMREDWLAREKDKWGYVPPGGESFAQVAERLRSWLGELRHDAVVVSHSTTGRILRGLYLGMPNNDIVNSPIPEHGRIYRFSKGSEATL